MNPELIEKIKVDPESSFEAGTAAEAIADIQTQLGVTFPPSYQVFLQHFNGGEFRFARMYQVTPEETGFFDLLEMVEHASECVAAIRDRHLLPFGDDYSGSYYCFDLTQPDGDGEYPIVFWDQDTSDDEGSFSEAESFPKFIEMGLEDEG